MTSLFTIDTKYMQAKSCNRPTHIYFILFIIKLAGVCFREINEIL